MAPVAPVAPMVALICRPAQMCSSSLEEFCLLTNDPPTITALPTWLEAQGTPSGRLWSSGSWPEGASVHRWPMPTAQRLAEGLPCFG